MNNEIMYNKTWYRYPIIKPNKSGLYEVCWHWNSGANHHRRFIDQIEYIMSNDSWCQISDICGYGENFDIAGISDRDKTEGCRRIIESWSEITYPKFR